MTVTVFYIVKLRYEVISEEEETLADKEKERRDIFERIKLMIFIVFFFFAYLPTLFFAWFARETTRYGLMMFNWLSLI